MERQSSRRLVIAIEQIMRSVSLNLYGMDVAPIADGNPTPWLGMSQRA